MFTARVRVSLVVCAVLGSIPGVARGQPSPAPETPAAPAPAAPPADTLAAEAARAKAAGQLIEVANDGAVAGCRDLGEVVEQTPWYGARGEIRMRDALKATGRARGASHVRYSGHVVDWDKREQREHGHFYDCARAAGAPAASAAASAPSAGSASAASPAPSAGSAGAAAPALSAESASATASAPSAGVASVAEPAPGTDAASAPESVRNPSEDLTESRIIPVAVSGQLEILPVGTLHTKLGTQLSEADIATTFGVSANLEGFLGRYVAVGLSPGVVLGLKDTGAMSSSTELDVRARARFGQIPAEGFGEYVYVTAGASWIFAPTDDNNSNGFIAGVGAGVIRRVERSSFFTLDLGFQAGFQSVTAGSFDAERSSRLFHIGLGFGRYLP